MKPFSVLICLLILSGCALIIDAEEAERIQQCQQLPNPDDRLRCERAASDTINDRYYDEQRGMTERGRYTLPKDLCPESEKDACDFD